MIATRPDCGQAPPVDLTKPNWHHHGDDPNRERALHSHAPPIAA